VAIGAQEDALSRFHSKSLERVRNTSRAHRYSLVVRVEVVKVQRCDVPVITADATATPGLGDEDLLEPPTPAGDRLRSTPLAAVIATALQKELRLAMIPAHHPDLEQSRVLR
jgi:hypothetical protein